jgi:hypothetical protein
MAKCMLLDTLLQLYQRGPSSYLSTWTHPHPVPLLPIGSGYFRANILPVEIFQYSQSQLFEIVSVSKIPVIVLGVCY